MIIRVTKVEKSKARVITQQRVGLDRDFTRKRWSGTENLAVENKIFQCMPFFYSVSPLRILAEKLHSLGFWKET